MATCLAPGVTGMVRALPMNGCASPRLNSTDVHRLRRRGRSGRGCRRRCVGRPRRFRCRRSPRPDGPGIEIHGGIPVEVGDPGLGRPGIAVVVGDLVHGADALGLGAAGAGIVGVGRGGAVMVPCASCEREGNGRGGTPSQSCSVQVHAGKLSLVALARMTITGRSPMADLSSAGLYRVSRSAGTSRDGSYFRCHGMPSARMTT